MKTYNSLTKRYAEQPHTEVFAHFSYNGKNGESWETQYEHLAGLAKKENWHFSTPAFKNKHKNQYPILVSYLNYTFLRAQELGLVSYSTDGNKSCFNTGLQTRDEKDIYALFYRNKESETYKAPDWTLYTFADSYSRGCGHLS